MAFLVISFANNFENMVLVNIILIYTKKAPQQLLWIAGWQLRS